jgi:hypothetical protein
MPRCISWQQIKKVGERPSNGAFLIGFNSLRMVIFAQEGLKMKQGKARKETAEERRKRVREEWWERLWLFHLNSCSAHDIVIDTYLVAPRYGSVHWVGSSEAKRIPARAELNDGLFEAAAMFFDKHRNARYVVVTVTENKTTKKSSGRVRVTDWLE